MVYEFKMWLVAYFRSWYWSSIDFHASYSDDFWKQPASNGSSQHYKTPSRTKIVSFVRRASPNTLFKHAMIVAFGCFLGAFQVKEAVRRQRHVPGTRALHCIQKIADLNKKPLLCVENFSCATEDWISSFLMKKKEKQFAFKITGLSLSN